MADQKAKKDAKRIIAKNKKAYHDFFIDETYECGIELFGTEVKSLREGKVNLKDSFCSVVKGSREHNKIIIGMIDKNIKYAELDANALTFDFDICLPNPVISRIFFFINRSFPFRFFILRCVAAWIFQEILFN